MLLDHILSYNKKYLPSENGLKKAPVGCGGLAQSTTTTNCYNCSNIDTVSLGLCLNAVGEFPGGSLPANENKLHKTKTHPCITPMEQQRRPNSVNTLETEIRSEFSIFHANCPFDLDHSFLGGTLEQHSILRETEEKVLPTGRKNPNNRPCRTSSFSFLPTNYQLQDQAELDRIVLTNLSRLLHSVFPIRGLNCFLIINKKTELN